MTYTPPHTHCHKPRELAPQYGSLLSFDGGVDEDRGTKHASMRARLGIEVLCGFALCRMQVVPRRPLLYSFDRARGEHHGAGEREVRALECSWGRTKPTCYHPDRGCVYSGNGEAPKRPAYQSPGRVSKRSNPKPKGLKRCASSSKRITMDPMMEHARSQKVRITITFLLLAIIGRDLTRPILR